MEKISNCIICGSDIFKDFLRCKDYLMKREEFRIVTCKQCGFRFTNPRPGVDEIGRYYESTDYISHNAQKKGIVESAYRILRAYSVKRKVKLLQRFPGNGNVLDIGCGTGEFLAGCNREGYKTTGIEPNVFARRFANEKLGLTVVPEESLEELPHASFSIITMWHVLEHVHDLETRMMKIKNLMSSTDSVFIVALPNSDSWDAVHYREYWAAFDLPRHLYHFTPATFLPLAEKFGFTVIEMHPMKLDAFYISLLSEKYKKGRHDFLSALFSGLKSNFYARNKKINYSSIIYILKPVFNEK